MPRSRKPLEQKTVPEFFRSSSPSQGHNNTESGPSRQPARSNVNTKGKVPTKRAIAPSLHKKDESDEVSDGGGSTSSDVGAIEFVPQVITVSSSSEEDDVVKSPRRPVATQRKVRKKRADSEEKRSTGMGSDSDGSEHVGVPVAWKKKNGGTANKRKLTAIQDSEDEEPQPRRKKLLKGVRPPTPEESDLLEEVDSNKIIESRLRTRDKKSKYLEKLEKHKRMGRKLGQPEPESDGNSAESEEEESIEPFSGAKPHTDSDSPLSEDEGLSGFIEEDSVNAVMPELPTEFSMNTYQDLMHHFKIICQLFVHLAVQDPEDRQSFMEQSLKDQYFSVPLMIARRKLSGMRDSSVTSSVWRTPFKKALETYPDFETVQKDYADPGCDACHLGGRMSTIVGRVSGEPYDHTTFLPLGADDSEDEEEDEEEDGTRILQKEFSLGRFCARRTRVFHKFTHWEYAVFKSLAQEVEDLKRQSTKRRVFVPVAYAGGSKPPDDLTDADGIMNWLDERGVVASLWHNIKEMMDNATNLEVASKRGEDRDDD